MQSGHQLLTSGYEKTDILKIFDNHSKSQPVRSRYRNECLASKRWWEMRERKDEIWTWLLPDKPRDIDNTTWSRSGGKWIIFDNEEHIKDLAEKLAPYIDDGQIESAKYWNGDPSAINVYSLDKDRWNTRNILKNLGARFVLVWEYDYALDKNLRSPFTFTYSWFSKFRTIIRSRGIEGSIKLLKEALKQKGNKE
jgi:hypothetical protein